MKKSIRHSAAKNLKQKPTSKENILDFPIIRVGVIKSIAGMWPHAK